MRDVILPMKAVPGELPAGSDWVHEPKWDGMRALLTVGPEGHRVHSATGRDITAGFGELADLATALGPDDVVLDGELVALDPDTGVPSFGRLQHRMHVTDPAVAHRLAAEVPVVHVVFDLLHLHGHDTFPLALDDRRRLLEQVVEPGPSWRLTPRFDDGEALLASARARGLEGVVSKRRDRPYEPGRRSPSWRKVKIRAEQEFVVGGFTRGAGGRAATLGALLVGYHDDRHRLVFAGRVGTGFTDADLDRWRRDLDPLTRVDPPFDVAPTPVEAADAAWCEPRLVVQVAFAEWTGEPRRLRHPVALGRRDDVDPSSVRLDQPPPPPTDVPS